MTGIEAVLIILIILLAGLLGVVYLLVEEIWRRNGKSASEVYKMWFGNDETKPRPKRTRKYKSHSCSYLRKQRVRKIRAIKRSRKERDSK